MAAKKTDFPVVTLVDGKSSCVSMLATMDLNSYIGLVEAAYEDQGGLAGQRAPIKTKTGMKIRSRLVDDLKHGAVIPPVVIGAVVSTRMLNKLKKIKTSHELISSLSDNKVDLSIIDGMQRTTALLEASSQVKIKQSVRIELWIARKVDDLIYRMLVLNTGQVPWDLKRQLETLYKPIVETIKEGIPDIRVIGLDQSNRRSQGGEYRSTRVIELFLAFTSRSIDIDVKERVAEEFAKIDITEATSSEGFLPLFIDSLRMMSDLDREVSRLGKEVATDFNEGGKVKVGRDLFTSAPASIGFMVAIAESIFGSPGFDYSLTDAEKDLAVISKSLSKIVKHMKNLSDEALGDFIDLATLNQRLGAQSGRIGEYERNLYKQAFGTLISKPDQIIKQGSMAPCWLNSR
ncbi:hypothetical protein R1L06_19095 [Stenotrophomonas sp. C4297]|uniref:hypothetical protein n=1 Tax=Stenotrophomonas sp. C4297 TaxID=3077847 RepID=UPI00293CB8F9|nr:hypothetical protein [Stenotrophomonas sp. C4297]MDV3512837.1 hypothetical protein [Stenotrophomonas sp. C4297]